MIPSLPERLQLQFLGLIGEQVRPWLDDLPSVVARLCRAWDVELQGTLANGWNSYVAFGERRGEPVVLKVSPKLAEGRAEIAALLVRDGVGVPPVLCHDFELAALLLPRVVPGTAVKTGEVDALAVAALLRRLHIRAEPALRHVPALGERLGTYWKQRATVELRLADALPYGLVADAAAAVDRLCDSWSRPVLLHGDFEARNVLHDGAGLVAIDCPAAVGDPGYDAASWVLSEGNDDPRSMRVLVAQLGEALDYPTQRIWQWAWPLAIDDLLDKLHEPGWPQERIGDAFEIARSVANRAAPQWRNALN